MESAIGFDPQTAVLMKAKEQAKKTGEDVIELVNSPEYIANAPSTLNTYLIKEVHDHIDAVLDSTDDLKGLEWHQVAPMGGNDPYTDENGVLTDSNDYAYRYTDIMIPLCA